MKSIKLKFVDFWYGFNPEDNYFYKLLSEKFIIEFSEKPDIIIYSCYGREYLKYHCIRIFYASENIRPDFSGCDYAITFDYSNHPRHYRLPLYAIYIDQIAELNWFNKRLTRDEAQEIWRGKSKFCCMVVSNGQSKKRLEFFKRLSTYRQVDSGGRVLNNIGGPVADKMKFIRDYRFVISFENSSYPGYTTEKIIEPLMGDCIPLYWGDPLVNTEFNKGCFLQLTDDKTEEQFIREIMAIDQNEEKAIDIIYAPKFAGNRIPDSIIKENLMQFFNKIFNDIGVQRPVANTAKGKLHKCQVTASYYIKRVEDVAKNALMLANIKKK
ncbi:MAG: putative biosynthesis related glycosyltransferase [Ferruginibacter sp.]|nr:putative biosynthesis related glycosyltransferase [Ferruginibacter sp.]